MNQVEGSDKASEKEDSEKKKEVAKTKDIGGGGVRGGDTKMVRGDRGGDRNGGRSVRGGRQGAGYTGQSQSSGGPFPSSGGYRNNWNARPAPDPK
jgi:hypothetical protein